MQSHLSLCSHPGNAGILVHEAAVRNVLYMITFQLQCHVVQVLGSNESRGSYDYALAHPREHMIAYHARYGSRAYAQMKIPAHYSITFLILVVSLIQYMSRKLSHEKVSLPS